MRERIFSGIRFLGRLAILCSVIFLPGLSFGQEAPAVVQAVQGQAEALPADFQESAKLEQGARVKPSDIISTNKDSKVLLLWTDRLYASLAEYSSLSFDFQDRKAVPHVQLIEGLARITNSGLHSNSESDHVLSTPLATVRPVDPNQPIDYIVEIYSPTTTIVSILSGRVEIESRTGDSATTATYDSCRTVYLTKDKKTDTSSIYAGDAENLVAMTTIAGTLPFTGTCPVAVAQETQPRESVITELRSYAPQYIENIYYDWFPYDDFSVLPYESGGYVALFPGIGSWFIPYYYPISPAILKIYIGNYLYRKGIRFHEHHLADLRDRRHHLRRLMDVSGRAGDLRTLARTQNQLDALRVQERLANRTLGRMQDRLGNVQSAAERFNRQLPRGSDLGRTLDASFRSNRNTEVARNFENQLLNQSRMENRLSNLGQNQVNQFTERLSSVRDPSQRLALRNEAAILRQNLMQGRIPVGPQQGQISQLAQRMSQTEDVSQRREIQSQLMNRLDRATADARDARPSERQELSSLRSEIGRLNNPSLRRDLSNEISQLQRQIRSPQQRESNLLERTRSADIGRPGTPLTPLDRRAAPGVQTPTERRSAERPPAVQEQRIQPRPGQELRRRAQEPGRQLERRTEPQIQRPSSDTRAPRALREQQRPEARMEQQLRRQSQEAARQRESQQQQRELRSQRENRASSERMRRQFESARPQTPRIQPQQRSQQQFRQRSFQQPSFQRSQPQTRSFSRPSTPSFSQRQSVPRMSAPRMQSAPRMSAPRMQSSPRMSAPRMPSSPRVGGGAPRGGGGPLAGRQRN
ncbi:hypothetical protein [Desulfomonile tiedjei]|uniref:Uncharacterized protein n=1 Tax=Desulfomonile tiedjei (strain ATCC 49306 / DSM 6799 / DCB-1) TaxID=706587 RepID=I4CCU6_DESTA|nr:hypothetical protein [Desulfomonile tiedjei]AFM27387.1 hypothetical protein Desti_4768 [Desulfomonile tiedjei DSM 6799]